MPLQKIADLPGRIHREHLRDFRKRAAFHVSGMFAEFAVTLADPTSVCPDAGQVVVGLLFGLLSNTSKANVFVPPLAMVCVSVQAVPLVEG